MKLYTAAQMREADRAAEDAGVASSLLMEAAGRGVSDLLLARWPDADAVLVLCGPGNNGGDGYVAARYLDMAGLDVEVLELASEPSTDDAAAARAAWRAVSGQDPAPLDPDSLGAHVVRAKVVVDALLGSGLTRPLEGALQDVARLLADAETDVLAVDVPTGVSSDAARPPGDHVHATVTAQLAGPKLASALEPARSAYGDWHVIDIGIPPDVLDDLSAVRLLDRAHPPPAGVPRPAHAHKYSVGTVLVVAGSPRYLGAAELACRGAYRGGAGLVTLAAEGRHPSGWPEVVLEPLAWDDQPLEALAAVDPKRAGCMVIGPGLDPRATEHLTAIVGGREGPIVLDAGALRRDHDLREAVRAHGACLLTPHVGEAATLLDASGGDILADPIGAARQIAEAWNAVVALKGATTIVARPSGDVAVSTTGHPGLASGGTGDVLSGLAGALLAASGASDATTVARAAERAVWRHGRAGERAAARHGLGLIATDVADALDDSDSPSRAGWRHTGARAGWRDPE